MEQLKIYIDRFKDGHKEILNESLPASFFDMEDKELHFPNPIQIKGEVYLANDHLIIHLDLKTTVILPCAICNEPAEQPIHIKDLYLTKPLSEIPGSVYDLTDEVRESILLQTPPFMECHQGKCPERENIKKYFKAQPEKSDTPPKKTEEIHFPFADL